MKFGDNMDIVVVFSLVTIECDFRDNSGFD